jgi:hypothetical protein
MKERMLALKRREIHLKMKNREHRHKMLSSDMLESLSGAWVEYSLLAFFGNCLTQKFELRKATREKVMKLGRKICWIVKSVGMFRLRIKQARERI